MTDATDRNGRRVTYSYDSGGRQTGQTWYDNAGHVLNTVTNTYDADGQLTGAADSYATLTFTYDSGGRMASAVTQGAGSTQPLVTLTYGYDAFGNRTSLSDSLAGTGGKGQGLTTYVYDAAFRLTTLTQSFGGGTARQVVLGYDSGGNLTSESRSVGGTAVTSALTYDAANRLGTIVDQYGTTGLATFAYGYDNGNRLTSENDTEVVGGTTYTYNATYAYDSSNELTTVTALRNGSGANEAYGYDSGGNRNTTGYATGGDNALTASPTATYAYDAEGNMTGQTDTSTHNVWTYSYDDRNRLTGVVEKNSGGTTLNQATYTYDSLDRRIGIQDNSGGMSTTTWTVFDGVEPYADFGGSTTSTVTERYLAAPGTLGAPLARTDSGGNSAWYLVDHLGSVHDVVNSSGTVVDHLGYDSYGNIVAETGAASGDRFKYAGMQWDATAGQYLAEHRAYSASAGRFESNDPRGIHFVNTNLYTYVHNNINNLVDPLGLEGESYDEDSRQPTQAEIDALEQQNQQTAQNEEDFLTALQEQQNQKPALYYYVNNDDKPVDQIIDDYSKKTMQEYQNFYKSNSGNHLESWHPYNGCIVINYGCGIGMSWIIGNGPYGFGLYYAYGVQTPSFNITYTQSNMSSGDHYNVGWNPMSYAGNGLSVQGTGSNGDTGPSASVGLGYGPESLPFPANALSYNLMYYEPIPIILGPKKGPPWSL